MSQAIQGTIRAGIGWRWVRVAGGPIVHYGPPRILRDSRTVCGRPLFDRAVELPAGLIGDVARCQVCQGGAPA